MSNSNDRMKDILAKLAKQRRNAPVIEPAPLHAYTTRLTVSIESEALAKLDELAQQLYPRRRAGLARALVIEQAIRAMHGQVMGDAGAPSITRDSNEAM